MPSRQLSCSSCEPQTWTWELRHIDGKLLWIQDLVAQKELNVKPVGTVYSIADLGTKPLTKASINWFLYWCNTYDGQGQRIGQDERDRLGEGSASRGTIQKLAKLLHRIVLLEGLEQVAGERMRDEFQEAMQPTNSWIGLLVLGLVAVVISLAIIIYLLWKKVKVIENELTEIKDNAKTDGMMIGAYGHESQEGIRNVRDYVKRVHKGLVKASGYRPRRCGAMGTALLGLHPKVQQRL